MSLERKLATLSGKVKDLEEDLYVAKKEKEDTTLLAVANSVDPLPRLALKNRRTLKGHALKISNVQWSATDPHLLVSCSQDGKLIVWDGFEKLKRAFFKLPCNWVICCAFSPSNKLVASGGLDNVISIFSMSDKSTAAKNTGGTTAVPKHELHGHTGYISSCKFMDDNHLVSGSGDSTACYWDVQAGEPISEFEHSCGGHIGDVTSVAVNGAHLFVTGSVDSHVKVWDVRTPMCAQTFRGHRLDVNSVQWFPSGEAVGSGSEDGSCRLWDLRADREMLQYSHNKIKWGVTSIDFSTSGRFLFAGYDDFNCVVWDTLKGRQLQMLSGHKNKVSSLGVSCDGTALCTASWDTTLMIWA